MSVKISDELNQEFLFSNTHNELLVKIALGKIDAVKVAKETLASRGVGINGKWVGFDRARQEWGLQQ